MACFGQKEGESTETIEKCDDLGDSQFCGESHSPQGITKGCATQEHMDLLAEGNLTGPGCILAPGVAFCLCSGNLCNNGYYMNTLLQAPLPPQDNVSPNH